MINVLSKENYNKDKHNLNNCKPRLYLYIQRYQTSDLKIEKH